MKIIETNLDSVFEVDLNSITDARGSFTKLFCNRMFQEIIGERSIVQINQSINNLAGTVRGMHYQNKLAPEMKLIKCIKGSVLDFAVDLRSDSKSFLKYHAINLTESNNKMIVIPEGCAHGFQALENDSVLLYFHTNYYSKEHESGIPFDDPLIGIDWPLEPVNMSERDLSFSRINLNNFLGVYK